MQRGFVYFRPVQIGFVRVVGPYKTSVPEAWRQLDEWFLKHATDIGRVTRYGLAHDNPHAVAPEALRYDACVEVPSHLTAEVADDLRIAKLPAGAFARKRYVGPYEGITEAFVSLRDQWAKAADVVLDTRRPLMTVYLNNPRAVEPKQLKVDLCVPVLSNAKGRRGHDETA